MIDVWVASKGGELAITELVKGKSLLAAVRISNETVVEELGGLPPVKMHCSVLAEQGIAAAIKDYYDRHPDKQIPPEVAEKIRNLNNFDPHETSDDQESEE